MQEVLVIVFSNLKHDARVSRQVQWLGKKHKVTIVCFDADPLEGHTIIRINQTPLTLLRKVAMALCLVLRWYSMAYTLFHNYGFLKEKLKGKSFDLVVANDIDAVPLAFSLRGEAKVMFDAHEYAPRHFENNKMWKFFFQPFYIHLCKKYIPQVDGMLTVGRGLAEEYGKNFGVKPVIISNATRYFDLKGSEVDKGRIRLVHHGIANPSRRLELMFEMMDLLDERFTLDLILMTSDFASPQTKAYIDGLKARAAANPRINILPPVRSSEVVPTIHRYDIGVFLLPPVNFNYANTLPNKLFDFVQARLGIAVGPTPEMAAIVNAYNAGVVSDDFTPASLASKLNVLSMEDLKTFKENAGKAAAVLNAEQNEILFNQIVDKVLSR